jgi:hypothetical protein
MLLIFTLPMVKFVLQAGTRVMKVQTVPHGGGVPKSLMDKQK